MALGLGSIAFVGFNADGTDNLAFVVLETIAAGTEIHFTDDEWNGTALTTGESRLTWAAGADIAAGTVITLDALNSGAPSSNHGSIAFTAGTVMNLDISNETVYAYIGTPAAPTAFLAAFANDSSTASAGVLDGTGLTFGVNAVTFYPFPLDVDTDIAVYNGRQVTGEGMSEFLGLINNAANWISQDTSADNSADGIAPDAPFTIGDFAFDANVQSVSFAPASLTVSATEGDSGTTTLTFTVVRSNSTIGDLSFSGSIVTQGPVNDADFGGPVPTSFSGTIPAGQSSATITVTVAGDTLFEADESISLTLQSVSNPSVPAYVSDSNATAGGTIANDDSAPVTIAFVGFNPIGTDNNLAFAALSDIAAGTVIHFTDNEWNGTALNTEENTWSWTATGDIVAGTVITLDNLNTIPTSNLGTVSLSGSPNPDLGRVNDDGFEIVYAYLGAVDAPDAFLTAISNTQFDYENTLAGTGLVEGVNAISLATYNDPRTSISAYDGPRTGLADIADYLPLINNPENWVKQGFVVIGAHDGVGPEAPFAPTAFVADPDTQIVEFAQDSLAVSHIEGDAETVTFTFTVERSGGTAGAVDFRGALTSLQADDSDFGIPLPTFSGTIPEGAASVEVTVTVAGDLLAEGNENFSVRLQTVSNDSVPAALGEDIVATGTIVDDDPAPQIAFVGFNTDAVDSLAFVTLGDIRAGAQIQFTNNNYSNASVTAATDWAFTWTATSDIAAGSIVNIDGIENRASATSNFGTIDFVIGASADLDSFAMVYAFQGSPDAPTRFLTGISNFNDVRRAIDLAGTGLEWGVNAINVPNARVAAYTGPRIGASDMDDFVALINDPANWIRQTSGSGTSQDGIAPDTPFPSTAFTIDPAVQTVFFALDSLNVAKTEGDSGTTTFTFTVQRAGGNATAGDLDFSGTIAAVSADADDFGGTVPLTFSGTILDGATTAVVTVTVSGDTLIEAVETFKLTLTSVSNTTETAVLADTLDAVVATGTILTDDATVVANGEALSSTTELTGTDQLVVEAGGMVAGQIKFVSFVIDAAIDNAGLITSTISGNFAYAGGDGRAATIWNRETGVIANTSGTTINLDGGEFIGDGLFTVNNDGQIIGSGRVIDANNFGVDRTVVVNNTGLIESGTTNEAIRGAVIVNNWGTIIQRVGSETPNQAAIDFEGKPGGSVHNYTGGWIEGSKHAATGSEGTTIINEAGGTMIGRNGSAVNIDNDPGAENTVYVINRGLMEGRSAHIADSDGDAVDVDGFAVIENWGAIKGLGHNGYHNGEPNVSEAIAVGAAVITNHEGGELYGYGRAIQIDNSSNSNALGATTIVNAGLIQGDGNLPTDVTPGEQALFAERIKGGEAINILGSFGDTLTNTGQIIGGVKMGGGDDVVLNKGTMTATGGSAIDMGEGDDKLNVVVGSVITGAILGGAGNDSVKLLGAGAGVLGATSDFENLVVQEGVWSVGDSTPYSDIIVEDGATLKSPIVLSGDDMLTVEAGGTVDQLEGTNTRPVTIDGPTTGVVIDNAGLMTTQDTGGVITANFLNGESTDVTIWNRETGVISMSYDNGNVIKVSGGQQTNGAPLTGVFTINNDGQIVGGYRAIDTNSFKGTLVLNNHATGLIQSSGDGTAFRGGGTINNWGIIRQNPAELDYGEDAIDFRSSIGSALNNYSGGLIEGGHHAVTGEAGLTVFNDAGGVIIGHNGSAVNIDNNGTEAEKVFITNRGTMEGRSAETEDSDGDAIDVDGLVQVLNYGRIAGLGAEGYHNAEPNVSEGIAIGGGTIVNNATGEIYGYGRAIQVDNSSNSNALGATTIVNDGLIQGDGHGPEGVDPEDAVQFDLRGNEAINLVGDYEDFVGNNSTGRIVGGVSMGGGRDTLNNSGAIVATGGSAIDMGDGNDQLNLYVGSTVTGAILLGAGDDVANATSAGAYLIDGGDGNDSISMYYTIFGGADTLYGGAGDDNIYGGLDNDFIDGGADNDLLNGEMGADTVLGGDGNDTIYGGADDSIEGGAGDDLIEVSTWNGTPASIDGGEGEDTLQLAGDGTGTLGTVSAVEHLVVEGGAWNIGAAANQLYADIVVKDGAAITNRVEITGSQHLTVEEGGSLYYADSRPSAIVQIKGTLSGAVIDNSGSIAGLNKSSNASGTLTIVNHGTGSIVGSTTDSVNAINVGAGVALTLINEAGGLIATHASTGSVIVAGTGSQIENAGTIRSLDSEDYYTGAAIDSDKNKGVVVHNEAGGLIEGSKHGITGKYDITVINDEDGTIIGRNGSAVNMDNNALPENTAHITNYGVMEGRSAGINDSDGDAIDVDGLLELDNWGTIKGLGANGYHSGEPNVSEAIAIGGGTIDNHEGGEIYGYGRAIQADDSENGSAFAATTITNAGLIQGDGHGPEGVSEEDAASFDLRGNEAINLVGDWADSLTNTGQIVGGVKMGGGDDVVLNKGTMTATGGSALDMGDGDDTLTSNRTIAGDVLMGAGDDKVTLWRTASVAGLIDLGAGNDTLLGGASGETLVGGEGADLLDGAGGNDLLTGGADGDQFHFDAASLDGLTVDRIADLSFAEGDTIVLEGFAAGSFAGIAGGNALGVTANGSKAVIDSLADIRELDLASDAVVVTRVGATNTLAITVIDGDSDIQQIRLDNAWAAYQELLDNGPAPNELRGSAGNDALDGKSGDQLVTGLAGDDLLIGNAGDDTLSGGDGADRFSFNAAQLAGSDADRITDLDFGAGDTLVFSKFAAGTFAMLADGNPVQMAAGGRGVTLDSFADLAEIDQASAALAIARDGATDTLVLSVTDADGDVQAVFIDNAWANYQAALV